MSSQSRCVFKKVSLLLFCGLFSLSVSAEMYQQTTSDDLYDEIITVTLDGKQVRGGVIGGVVWNADTGLGIGSLDSKGNFIKGDYAPIETSLEKVPSSVTGTGGAKIEMTDQFIDNQGNLVTDYGKPFDEGGTVRLVQPASSDAAKSASKAAAVKPDAAKKQEANITKDTKGQQKGTSKGKKNEGEKQAKEGNGVNTGHEVNVLHYPILILEGVEARKQKEFTRKVVVEGASKLQASQGSPQGSDIHPDVSLEATTLGCAANSMSVLLENNPVRLQLLNLDDLDLDTEGGKFVAKYRRNLLLQEYAVAAEIIGEGSNAISEKFYDRIQGFVGEIPGTYGTLGAMSVLNDSERYPYFEMVRQLALTAVQLGLSGATTLANVKAINENAVNEEVNK